MPTTHEARNRGREAARLLPANMTTNDEQCFAN